MRVKYHERRKISVGTKVMLVIAPLVLIGSVLLLNLLSSGYWPDFSRTHTGIVSQKGNSTGENRETGAVDGNRTTITDSDTGTNKAEHGKSGMTETRKVRHFTLTAAGTAVMEGDIRKNCYFEDVRIYDFSDVMSLLKTELRSDVNILFIENIIMDDEKVTDIIVPSSLTAMLKTAGFNMAACGFSRAWDQGQKGIAATRTNLQQQGITPLGIYESEEQNIIRIMDCGGIPTAFLQYTDTIQSGTRNKMIKQNEGRSVPAADPEEIRADIEEARKQGAKAVIVLLNWGKKGGKQPEKNQRNLAQQIADAGADLIIGSGSRYPQTAEYLSAGDRQVMCVWSLGTTLSGERKNTDWLSGYLFHAELILDENDSLHIQTPAYTPIYTWKSKLSGKLVFRCLPANRLPPDGMDSDQESTMGKVAEVTRKALQGSPLQER